VRRGALVAFGLAIAAPAAARDYGQQGAVWPIAEPDLLQQIHARLTQLERTGETARLNEQLKQRTIARINRPQPVAGLVQASIERTWRFDPTITVERDIADNRGRVIVAAGTRVNPLDTVPLRAPLVFLDGDEPAQLAWALKRFGSTPAKLILVKGAPLELMTLIGTIIYIPPKDDDPGKFIPIAGDASSTLVTSLLDGTVGEKVLIQNCDETDKCLDPGWQPFSLPASKALRPRVAALIDGMVQAIHDDTPITDAQKELLQVSSIPLYKILAVQAAYGRGMPTDDRATLAEIASVDLLFALLDRIVSESSRSMSSFIGADEAKIAMWQGQVNTVQTALADRQANTHLRVTAIMQIIEKTAFIENVLAASMSPGMAASLDWSRGVQNRALTH